MCGKLFGRIRDAVHPQEPTDAVSRAFAAWAEQNGITPQDIEQHLEQKRQERQMRARLAKRETNILDSDGS